MAIPKLLDKMRHSVQDTGDEMTGRLSVNADGVDIIDSTYATLRLGNNDENDLIIGKNSLLGNILITADGGIQLTSETNEITFASQQGSITGIADPVEAQDVATKNYVDNATPVIANASTSEYGITKLSTSTSSTSTSLAATPSAVKSAYDLANAAMPKTGGTFTGAIQYGSNTTISSSTGYYRPIRVSTSAPTSSDGNVGDIWIQYFE